MVTAMVENSKAIDSILIWFRTSVFFGCRLMLSWSVWDIVNLHPNVAKVGGFCTYLKNALPFIQPSPVAIQIPENGGAVNWLLLSKLEDIRKKSSQGMITK